MFKIRLKALREGRGMTQMEFATAFGVSKGTVGMWESGAREPRSLNEFQRIADYFGVTTDYLLGRDEKKPTPVSEDGLDNTEKLLMEYVRDLTEDQQQMLLAQMQVMKKSQKASSLPSVPE